MTRLTLQIGFLFFFIALGPLAVGQPSGAQYPIITEIMYNPPEFGLDTTEFLEIYNPNQSSSLDLSGYYFSSGILYIVPNGVIIPPDGRIVISIDSTNNIASSKQLGYQWDGGALLNQGEAITLRTPDGTVADTVFYDDMAPWPIEADGDGASLVLCDPFADNNLPGSWSASENATGVIINTAVGPIEIFADPWEASACTTIGIEDGGRGKFAITPNPSDGDFRIQMAPLQETSAVCIYNYAGKIVDSKVIAAGTTSVWLNTGLKPGHYILSVEHQNGLNRLGLVIQ